MPADLTRTDDGALRAGERLASGRAVDFAVERAARTWAAADLLPGARRGINRRSGKLQRSLRTSVRPSGPGRVEVRVQSSADYSGIIEYGKRGSRAYLRPAIVKAERALGRRISRELDRELGGGGGSGPGVL